MSAEAVTQDMYEAPIPFTELGITVDGILAAFGYDGDAPEPVQDIVRRIFPKLETTVDARGGFRVVGGIRVSVADGVLVCGETEFAVDRIIAAQLRHCDAMAVFAATAGAAVERWSRRSSDDGDPLTGYILDVVGSEIAEAAANWLEARFDAGLRAQALGSTNRYSPGYCGWNVAEQKKLFALLPPEFCGITLTESSLMLPIKSVSGIIGIGKDARKEGYQCAACEDEDCLQRKGEG